MARSTRSSSATSERAAGLGAALAALAVLAVLAGLAALAIAWTTASQPPDPDRPLAVSPASAAAAAPAITTGGGPLRRAAAAPALWIELASVHAKPVPLPLPLRVRIDDASGARTVVLTARATAVDRRLPRGAIAVTPLHDLVAPDEVTVPPHRDRVTLELRPARALRVFLRDEQGRAVAGTVYARHDGDRVTTSVPAGPGRPAELERSVAWRELVGYAPHHAPERVLLEHVPGYPWHGREVQVDLRRAQGVRGRVVDPHGRARKSRVLVVSPSPEPGPGRGGHGTTFRYIGRAPTRWQLGVKHVAVTDADGRFEVWGIDVARTPRVRVTPLDGALLRGGGLVFVDPFAELELVVE